LASSESTVITFTIASQVADGILAGLEENLLATTLIFLQFWLVSKTLITFDWLATPDLKPYRYLELTHQ